MLRSFHLNFLQNKIAMGAFRDARLPTSPSSFRSSNNLFRPISASLVPLTLFSNCFTKSTFPRFFSKNNNSIGNRRRTLLAKISVTSPIVINMPTRELLAGETKNSFV